MKRDADKTVQALLDAAEKLMSECSDPSEVTARAITAEAGVNLAMINYFFGSREGLLFEVFTRLQNKAMESDSTFRKIMNGDMTPKQKLIEVHIRSIRLMLENHNLSKAMTRYVLVNRPIQADRGSVQFVQAHFGDTKTEGESRLIAFELSSLHELAVLRYEEICEVCGKDLKDTDTLRAFVTENVNRFLGG